MSGRMRGRFTPRMRGCKAGISVVLVLFLLAAFPVSAFAAQADVLFWTSMAPRQSGSVPLSIRTVQEAVPAPGGGDDVYVLGGVTDTSNSTAVIGTVAYNTLTDNWTFGVNLPHPIYAASSVARGTDIWIFGGIDTVGGIGASAEVWKYDTNNQTITQQPSLPAARRRAGACLIGTTAYLVGGEDAAGNDLNTIVEYDLLSGNSQVVAGAVMPNSIMIPLTFSWYDPGAGTTDVYFFGGSHNGVTQSAGWKWNPSSPSVFTPRQSMVIPSAGSRAKAMSNGKVYLPTSAGSGALTTEYDCAGDQWFISPARPHDPSGPGCSVTGNKLYVIGGWDGNGLATGYTDVATIVPAVNNGTGNTNGGQTTGVSVGANTVSITLPGGATAGQVTVSTIPVGSIPGGGVGFRINGQLYDIATSSSGWTNVTVRLPYYGNNPNPVVRHWDGSTWQPITLPTSTNPLHNPANGVITQVNYGLDYIEFTTPSLSPFGVEDPPVTTSTPASSTLTLALLVIAGLGVTLWSSRKRRAVA